MSFEELMNELKTLGELAIYISKSTEIKTILEDLEELDHKIWLIKIKLYNLSK